jgi:hypothetical protein
VYRPGRPSRQAHPQVPRAETTGLAQAPRRLTCRNVDREIKEIAEGTG